MAKVETTITITAPVEKIFNYIQEMTNLPEIWPSLVQITDIKQLPNGGFSNRFVYKMAGIRLEGTSQGSTIRQNFSAQLPHVFGGPARRCPVD